MAKILADQVKLVTDEEYFKEEIDDLGIEGGNEVGDGGEVGGGITGEGHEDDVLPAALLDFPAGGDAPGVGIEDDLQQDGGIIGGGAGVVIAIALVKYRKIDSLSIR